MLRWQIATGPVLEIATIPLRLRPRTQGETRWPGVCRGCAENFAAKLIIHRERTSIAMLLMLTPVTITIALLCCAFVVALAYVAIDERV